MTEARPDVYVEQIAAEDGAGRFGIVSLSIERGQLPDFLATFGVADPAEIPYSELRELCSLLNGGMEDIRTDSPSDAYRSAALLIDGGAQMMVHSDQLGHATVAAISPVPIRDLATLCNPLYSRVGFELYVFSADETAERKDVMEPIGQCVLRAMFLPPSLA